MPHTGLLKTNSRGQKSEIKQGHTPAESSSEESSFPPFSFSWFPAILYILCLVASSLCFCLWLHMAINPECVYFCMSSPLLMRIGITGFGSSQSKMISSQYLYQQRSFLQIITHHEVLGRHDCGGNASTHMSFIMCLLSQLPKGAASSLLRFTEDSNKS